MSSTTHQDTNTIQLLYKTFRRELVRHASAALGDNDAAFDLVQEVFTDLIGGSITMPSATHARPALHRIVRYRVLHALRRRRLETSAQIHLKPLSITEAAPDVHEVGPLVSALAELSARQQRAARYHWIEGHSLRETAMHLGISKASLCRDLAHARRHLQKQMTSQLDETEFGLPGNSQIE